MCDEFLFARVRGRAQTEAVDAHDREDESLVYLCLDQYSPDVQVRLEITSRVFAITCLRSLNGVQMEEEASRSAFRLLCLAYRCCIVLDDSRIFNVLVSIDKPYLRTISRITTDTEYICEIYTQGKRVRLEIHIEIIRYLFKLYKHFYS